MRFLFCRLSIKVSLRLLGPGMWHKISKYVFPNTVLEIMSFVLYLILSPLGTAGGRHQLLMFTPLLYITIFFVKCYIFF